MPALAHTSVPAWAVPKGPAGPGFTGVEAVGASCVLVAVGDLAAHVIRTWAANLTAMPDVRIIEAADIASAQEALGAALGEARVGVRVWLAGPTGACLALRGTATCAGVEDDELYVVPTSVGPIELFCVHCAAVTTTDAAIGQVVVCDGCNRRLLVHYHVSRRSGRFLGYMVDAEEAGG